MFGLEKLFGKEIEDVALSKDRIAEMLKVSPEALASFEQAYAKAAIDEDEQGGLFCTNSRQAAAKNKKLTGNEPEAVSKLVERIVVELAAQTPVYVYDGKQGTIVKPTALPESTSFVSNTDISQVPTELRPQLSGNLMQVDIAGLSSESLMFYWDMFQKAKDPKKKKFAYDHFRQGLDILDLDALTYAIIGTNRNSMGDWLPQLVEACRGTSFFRIPATVVARVPMPLLQLTRLEYHELTPTTIQIVDDWAHRVFRLDDAKDYFVKTGTYSSKFDFRNCHIHGEKEVQELGEYLLYIHFQALQMAGPLSKPRIYGVSTTNEWVVREFIPDLENNPCIYHGLPLHTEYRVFVDCDTKDVIGISPYWEPETMLKRFSGEEDADIPHQMHDYVIYKAHEEALMRRYHENKDSVVDHIREILPQLDLHGQWSIDVMQNGNDFYLIDMAIAENSAFYNCVPEQLRRPSAEDWMPKIEA